ncbi:acyltransferase family protein [Vibrio lentus]|uniref:acyltransferase family protein n=1 Tax=Vibrio lentus TaxID=136468 RepID=UPI000C83A492|nr:acyltransferase family protein [Vibrio lentus]PMJ91347.1 hypothetical protein BCU13_23165 [Vibrio lentus]
MNFRYDINGLRAIAVIAVVLFHFNPAWVPGGFAGVDVFFVISGFLMTGIIFRGLENDDFNLLKFYLARASRIIPALIILCLVLLIFAWFYLPPIEYRDLSKHAVSSMSFFSNVIYWKESGYFDVASHEKWLLHTWSLSVEWQFYIIYPIVLVALKRYLSLDNLKRLIVVGTVLGFVFSAIATMKWPNPAYYLLPTRAWEMMLGGVAFLYPWNASESKRKIIEIGGLLLVLASYVFISSDIPWPGYFALVPVLGTYLMIISNQKSSILTNNYVFQYIGRYSYTIYLWHWPVVVFFNYFHNKSLVIFLYVFLSFVLGVIFGLVDEVKSKRKAYVPIFVLSCSSAILIFVYDGMLDRVPREYQVTKQQFRNKYEGHAGMWNASGVFINGSEKDFDYIVIGNSFARHYNSFFVSSDFKVVNLAVDGCLSTRRNYAHYSKSKVCRDRYQFLLDFVQRNPGKKLIFSSSWSGYNCKTRRDNYTCNDGSNILIEEMKALVEDVSSYVSGIYVVGKTQGSEVIPFKYLAESYLPGYRIFRDDIFNKRQKEKVIDKNEALENSASEVGYTYIDPTDALCSNNYCYVIKNGQPLYTDHGHLTKLGSSLVGGFFMNKINSHNLP